MSCLAYGSIICPNLCISLNLIGWKLLAASAFSVHLLDIVAADHRDRYGLE